MNVKAPANTMLRSIVPIKTLVDPDPAESIVDAKF